MKLGYVLKPVYFVKLLWLEELKKGGKRRIKKMSVEWDNTTSFAFFSYFL